MIVFVIGRVDFFFSPVHSSICNRHFTTRIIFCYRESLFPVVFTYQYIHLFAPSIVLPEKLYFGIRRVFVFFFSFLTSTFVYMTPSLLFGCFVLYFVIGRVIFYFIIFFSPSICILHYSTKAIAFYYRERLSNVVICIQSHCESTMKYV